VRNRIEIEIEKAKPKTQKTQNPLSPTQLPAAQIARPKRAAQRSARTPLGPRRPLSLGPVPSRPAPASPRARSAAPAHARFRSQLRRARRLPPSLPGRAHGSGSSPSPGRAPLFRTRRISSLPVAPLRRARALGPRVGHPEPSSF
jgi:hypothetical protein